jgi:hypothetical protein
MECAWFSDPLCGTLKPDAFLPQVEDRGVVCSDYNGGWCGEANRQVWNGLSATKCPGWDVATPVSQQAQPTQVIANWKRADMTWYTAYPTNPEQVCPL